ncbi:flavin-dependent dehydrogenase [Edaphobacter lichenicola]|uniref:Flavin-dependent dehydrogenase n=1 Tax=Tunturiibacter lichenicola TaxID=2051959 RepID=A0A7W8J646_9BACT|nr:flavin-dependent dehydrogenase [Edaphobacter lichenicola]
MFLVGNASGSIDAITGEGLAIMFRQAAALATSIEAGGLDDYNSARPLIGKTPRTTANRSNISITIAFVL